jgi:TetR/AcrR family transcriptional repressor of mexJK operon
METLALHQSRRSREDKRRARILGAALAMFHEDGYAAVSMSSILSRVGGSKGTLYHYFSSKEGLFAAAMSVRCLQLRSILGELRAEEGPFRNVLQRFGESIATLLFRDDWIATFRLVIAETAHMSDLGQIFLDAGLDCGRERVTELLCRGIAQGELKADDVREMSRTFLDLLTSDLHDRLCNVRPEPSQQAISRIAERATRQFLAIYGREKA